MFKQLVSKEKLLRSLPMTVLVCVTIFFLVGCTSNYNLTGTTTNGTPGSTQTQTTGSGSTNSGSGSTNSGSGSTNSGSGSTNSGSGSTNSGSGSTNSGSGSTNSGSAAFQVTSVSLSMSPSDITGIHCGGAPLTVTDTATFHIAPNGPGGEIHFNYSTHDGHDTTAAGVTVGPGQTTATFQFSRTDAVGPAFSFPTNTFVDVTSPNSLPPAEASPTGQCSQ